MNAMKKGALFSCAVLLALAFQGGDRVDAAAATENAAPKPDFSGVWLPNPKESGHWPEERPFTKTMTDARAQWTKMYAPINFERDDDHTSCLPYTLPYMLTTITQYPFEIVTTPRRIYVFTEVYGQTRRIDLDSPPPQDALPSRTGISRGHWEGSQLVVETTNIFPENEGSRFPSSPALRVVERISLEEGGQYGKQLINEMTVNDPLVYEKPVTIRMVYKWARDVQVGEYICEQDLWDQHLDGSTSKIPWR
ncbi:MAG: hypothetical protein WDO56_35945 [Gammaproteobacteria bacterium]